MIGDQGGVRSISSANAAREIAAFRKPSGAGSSLISTKRSRSNRLSGFLNPTQTRQRAGLEVNRVSHGWDFARVHARMPRGGLRTQMTVRYGASARRRGTGSTARAQQCRPSFCLRPPLPRRANRLKLRTRAPRFCGSSRRPIDLRFRLVEHAESNSGAREIDAKIDVSRHLRHCFGQNALNVAAFSVPRKSMPCKVGQQCRIIRRGL